MIKRSTKTPKPTIVYGWGDGEEELYKQLAKSSVDARLGKGDRPTLAKSILNILNGPNGSIERLAFETDPTQINNYAGVYKNKMRLVPDSVLKRIAIQDCLVASIVRARTNHISAFGRPKKDRFSTGFEFKPNTGVLEKMTSEEKKEFHAKLEKGIKRLNTCGDTEGLKEAHQASFAEYLALSARSAVVCGRIATEIVRVDDAISPGKKKFHHFVATDAGTIYKATTDHLSQESVRRQAYHTLCRVLGKKLEEERFTAGEYAWVQVIEGTPKQVFTNDEMKCYNFYAVPDVELDGYPVTPIDTVITAITTHINITTHNKMYFQSGRATRGMLVLKSDDIKPETISQLKQQFCASINNASNSFRMPVFGCPTDGEITWQPIDNSGSRDMEFQYLSDMNTREIMTAFLMGPDELPGYSYLSRGTASQALSECIAADCRILTKENGLIESGKYVGKERERLGVLWSGKNWVKGRVFRSGIKDLIETELDCGVKLHTSPDHRFRIINDDGELDWKHQSELKVDDRVLISKKPVIGDESKVPIYKGRVLPLAVMEILGWAIGDGTLVDSKKRCGANLQLFYHSEFERDVWADHERVLKEFGLSTSHKETFRTDEQIEYIKKNRGFKTAARSVIKNIVYDTDFCRWMIDMGFNPSAKGKVIPAVIHSMPEMYRRAFLKGLFSADGGKVNDTGSVALTIQKDDLRDQIRQLLLGLGIRTLGCKGALRRTFRNEKKFSNKLFIKDRAAFWNLVGFCQPHKQPIKQVERWSIDRPPMSVINKCLLPCVSSVVFSSFTKSFRDGVKRALGGGQCSYQYLEKVMIRCGVEAPEWFNDCYLEPVKAIVDLQQKVEMYDVEMYDDVHAFSADGVITHNSNSEYKLEAARDVGIRPLLTHFEDFINADLLPLVAPDLVGLVKVCLVGLEASTPEKEASDLTAQSQLYMTYNDIMQRVEKATFEKDLFGEFPLNPQYQQVLDKYLTVGQILARFGGIKDADKDPKWDYCRDPFFFQQQQLMMEKQQMQQAAQQPQQSQQEQGEAQDTQNQTPEQQDSGPNNIGKAIEQAYDLMQKSEKNLPPEKRKLLAQHKKTVEFFTKGLEADSKDAIDEILGIAKKFTPRK